MSDLFSIASSGITAARTALSVTGENIANVDTPGYRRRDTVQTEVAGAEASPFLTGVDQQGVQVSEIRRAFDGLLAARSREAGGALAAAEATAPYLRQLETRLMADGGGPLPQIEAFFDGMAELAATPEDIGLRRVTVQAGQALASGVADLALGVETLHGAVAEDAAIALSEANRVIAELADLQGSIAVQKGTGARNPLLDRRDALVSDLAGLVDISVSLDPQGLAEVRLGNLPTGPVLISGAQAGYLAPGEPGRLIARSWNPADPDRSRAITGGTLGGLAAAEAALADLSREIDAWAGGIARDLNAVHGAGLDLEGTPGGDLLSLAGWQAEAVAANRGATAATVQVIDAAALPQGPIELVHDAAAGLWRAQGPGGDVIAEGADRLSLPGLSIALEGEAADGDRIRLRDTSGWAGHMRWLISDGADLAAAGALRADPLPGNTGGAQITASLSAPPAADLPDLAALLAAGGAVEFLSAGVVGQLPAGTTTALLQALPREAAQEFGIAPGAAVSGLTLALAGGDVAFDAPAGLSADAFAAALATGAIRGPDGQRLSDLGLSLSAGAGGLTLLAAEGAALPEARIASTAGVVAGVTVADPAPAAQLSVFTREGRQIAGPPLDPAAAQALLTEANGFVAGAVYTAAGDLAGQTRLSASGDVALMLGSQSGIAPFTGAGPVPPAPASAVALDGAGLAGALALPEGSSAARRAVLLAQEFPVQALAQTSVALDLPASGVISFQLTGDALTARTVTADLSTGGPGALADAINAHAVTTGITAERAPDGRFVLTHRGGADIVVQGTRHDAGGTLGLTRLAADGAPLGGQVTLGAGGPDGARITGTVTLHGPGDFAASEDGVLRTGQPDGFLGGAMTREIALAGAEQGLGFAGAGIAPGLAIGLPDGREVTIAPDPALAALSGPDQAAAMLAALRRDAPASRLIGAPLAAPPQVGAMLRLDLGGDGYAIRMGAEGLIVEGPEPGRISAGFDAAGRLVVETVGGDTDGAALRLPLDAAEAARFGLGLTDAPRTQLIGTAPVAMPAVFGVEIGGQRHDLTLTAAGVALPAGFPGSASIEPASGGVILEIDARAGAVRIPPEAGAADAGFATLGLRASLSGDRLNLIASDGRRLETRALPGGSAQSVALAEAPGEDLLVVMTGPGALRLGGAIGPVADLAAPARELRVIDAATGRVGLFDSATGTRIAERTLDATGSADLGGYSVTLTGALATGDRFTLTPNTGGQGDGRGAERLADLARRDSTTDRGGFAALYADLLGEVGAQVAAADLRVGTATTAKESADRAEAKLSGVDLDTEAARLLQQQQAYQANAQVLNIARQLFDTLINAL